jgi:diketogulonate reductase-like aldo/keto reductase
MIDTAEIYRNQKYIGNFLEKNNIDRSKIWITSKVSFVNTFKEEYIEVIKSIEKTFDDLKTNYIDLYLIHCPDEKSDLKIWNILREYQKEGKIRYVGLSNFTLEKLKIFINKIGDEESKHIFCNQIEYNPFLNRKDLVDFCNSTNIKVIAYGSLNKKNKIVEEIANKLGKSQEQVLLKWAQQNNVYIIPMAQDIKFIKDNISLDFQISKEDMTLLDNLNENYAVYTKYL